LLSVASYTTILRFQAQRTIEIFARFTNIYASSRSAQKKRKKKKKEKKKERKKKKKKRKKRERKICEQFATNVHRKSSSRLSPPLPSEILQITTSLLFDRFINFKKRKVSSDRTGTCTCHAQRRLCSVENFRLLHEPSVRASNPYVAATTTMNPSICTEKCHSWRSQRAFAQFHTIMPSTFSRMVLARLIWPRPVPSAPRKPLGNVLELYCRAEKCIIS